MSFKVTYKVVVGAEGERRVCARFALLAGAQSFAAAYDSAVVVFDQTPAMILALRARGLDHGVTMADVDDAFSQATDDVDAVASAVAACCGGDAAASHAAWRDARLALGGVVDESAL